MFIKLIVALVPMVLALPLAMDIYVPAIPHIAEQFMASDQQMLLTLNLFMLTAGFLQLLIGPISDYYGRKKISLLVVVFFTIGNLGCGLANNIDTLILFRVIQALGSCGMMVLAFAIVRDHYVGTKSAKAYSFLNSFVAFSPIFAPFIGSCLDIYFNWRATFLSLLLVSFSALASVGYWLPESLPEARREELSTKIISQYKNVISNKVFFIYTLSSAFGLSYLYLFCAISPYILMRNLAVPQIQYGYYFAFMGISLFLGSFFSGLIVEKLGVWLSCILGNLTALIGGILMLFWYQKLGLTVHGFVYPMLLIGTGGTICMSIGASGAMDPFHRSKGIASAAGGAFRYLFAGLVGYVLIMHEVTSVLPLALPAIAFSVIGLLTIACLSPRLLMLITNRISN